MTQAEQTIAGVALPRERGRRVRRTNEETGWAWAGSQRQIQSYTNTPPLVEVLDREIKVALPVLAGTALEWRSPLATERYEEPTGEEFWSAIDQPRLRGAAPRTAPTGSDWTWTPRRDGGRGPVHRGMRSRSRETDSSR